MNSSCSGRSKFTNSGKHARRSGRSAAPSIESMDSMDSMESNFDSNGAPYGRGPASRKEQPFSVVMATRIAFHSMDEVTRKKKPIDSRKNELRSCSTGRERSRFVLENRQLAFLRVLLCISDV